jgi:hypothetical protein
MPAREFSRMVFERLEELDEKVNRILGMLLGIAKRDIEMAKKQEEFQREFDEFKQKFADYTTSVGERVNAAVAAAREAWEAESDQAFEEATRQLDDLGNQLVEEQGEFTPSGN